MAVRVPEYGGGAPNGEGPDESALLASDLRSISSALARAPERAVADRSSEDDEGNSVGPADESLRVLTVPEVGTGRAAEDVARGSTTMGALAAPREARSKASAIEEISSGEVLDRDHVSDDVGGGPALEDGDMKECRSFSPKQMIRKDCEWTTSIRT